MSAHDPFDGIYDDEAPAAQPAAQEESKSEVTVVAPDDVDVSVESKSRRSRKPKR